MMKRLIFVLSILWATSALAQSGTTVVSAQVQDSGGHLYVNCVWSVVFVGQNTTPGAGPYAPASYLNGQQGTCDSQGNFTINLADNINTVTPTPSQWSFSICSGSGYVPAGPYCKANILITITGATQNITAALSAVLPILPTGGTATPGTPNGSLQAANSGSFGGVPGTNVNFSTGAVTAKNLNAIRYIDAANSAGWSGSDIGAWINAAYADLPSTGGTIQVDGGVQLNATTPMVFTTANKPVLIQCSPGSASFIGWTGSTSATIFTFDTALNTNQHPIGMGITGCYIATAGPNTETLIQLGSANSGEGYNFDRNTFVGFGTAVNLAPTIHVPFNVSMLNTNVVSSTIGLNLTGSAENIRWQGGICVATATCVSVTGVADASLYGLSCDSDSTINYCVVVNNSEAILSIYAPHFENPALGVPSYGLVQAGTLNIYGGVADDDVTSGTYSTQWFNVNPAGFLIVDGLVTWSAGRTTNTALFATGGTGRIATRVIDISPTLLPTIYPTASFAVGNVFDASMINGANAFSAPAMRTSTFSIPGATSGAFSMSAAAIAGSPSTWLPPTADGTPGNVLTFGTPSAGKVQLTWGTGGGGSFNPATPGAIGGTTPSFATFTALNASPLISSGPGCFAADETCFVNVTANQTTYTVTGTFNVSNTIKFTNLSHATIRCTPNTLFQPAVAMSNPLIEMVGGSYVTLDSCEVAGLNYVSGFISVTNGSAVATLTIAPTSGQQTLMNASSVLYVPGSAPAPDTSSTHGQGATISTVSGTTVNLTANWAGRTLTNAPFHIAYAAKNLVQVLDEECTISGGSISGNGTIVTVVFPSGANCNVQNNQYVLIFGTGTFGSGATANSYNAANQGPVTVSSGCTGTGACTITYPSTLNLGTGSSGTVAIKAHHIYIRNNNIHDGTGQNLAIGSQAGATQDILTQVWVTDNAVSYCGSACIAPNRMSQIHMSRNHCTVPGMGGISGSCFQLNQTIAGTEEHDEADLEISGSGWHGAFVYGGSFGDGFDIHDGVVKNDASNNIGIYCDTCIDVKFSGASVGASIVFGTPNQSSGGNGFRYEVPSGGVIANNVINGVGGIGVFAFPDWKTLAQASIRVRKQPARPRV